MNDITIHSNKQTEYQFELTSSGVELNNDNVFFLIHTSDVVSIRISCKKVKGQVWQLIVPQDTLKDGCYEYVVCVVVENYYFEPYSGNIIALTQESFSVQPVKDADDSSQQEEPQHEDAEENRQQTKAPSKKQKQRDKAINEQIVEPKVDVIIEQSIRDYSKPVSNKPIIDFNVIKHPYATLKDNGETDKKVRNALQRFTKNDD